MDALWSFFDSQDGATGYKIPIKSTLNVTKLNSDVDFKPLLSQNLISELLKSKDQEISTKNQQLLTNPKFLSELFSILSKQGTDVKHFGLILTYLLNSIPDVQDKNPEDPLPLGGFSLSLIKILNQNKQSSKSVSGTDITQKLIEDNERNNYFAQTIIGEKIKSGKLKQRAYTIVRTMAANISKFVGAEKNIDDLADKIFNNQLSLQAALDDSSNLSQYNSSLIETFMFIYKSIYKSLNAKTEFENVIDKLQLIGQLAPLKNLDKICVKSYLEEIRNFIIASSDVSNDVDNLINAQNARLQLRTKALNVFNNFIEKSDENVDKILCQYIDFPNEMKDLHLIGESSIWDEFLVEYRRMINIFLKKAGNKNFCYVNQITMLPVESQIVLAYMNHSFDVIYHLINEINSQKLGIKVFDYQELREAALNGNNMLFIPWSFAPSNELDLKKVIDSELDISEKLFVLCSTCFNKEISNFSEILDYIISQYNEHSVEATLVMIRLMQTQSKSSKLVKDFVREQLILLGEFPEANCESEAEYSDDDGDDDDEEKSYEEEESPWRHKLYLDSENNKIRMALNLIGADKSMKITDEIKKNYSYPSTENQYQLTENEAKSVAKYLFQFAGQQTHFAARQYFTALIALAQDPQNRNLLKEQKGEDGTFTDYINAIAEWPYENQWAVRFNNRRLPDSDFATLACKTISIFFVPTSQIVLMAVKSLPRKYGDDLMSIIPPDDPTDSSNYTSEILNLISYETIKDPSFLQEDAIVRLHLLRLYMMKKQGDLREIELDVFQKLVNNNFNYIVDGSNQSRILLSESVSQFIIKEYSSDTKLMECAYTSLLLTSNLQKFEQYTSLMYPGNKNDEDSKRAFTPMIQDAFSEKPTFPIYLFFNYVSQFFEKSQEIEPVKFKNYDNFLVVAGKDMDVNGIHAREGYFYSGTIDFDTSNSETRKIIVFSSNEGKLNIKEVYNNRKHIIAFLHQCQELWNREIDTMVHFGSSIKNRLISKLAIAIRKSMIKKLFETHFPTMSSLLPEKTFISKEIFIKASESFIQTTDEPPLFRFKKNNTTVPLIDQLIQTLNEKHVYLNYLLNPKFPFKVDLIGQGADDQSGVRKATFTDICAEFRSPKLGILTNINKTIDGMIPNPSKDPKILELLGFWLGLCIAHKIPFQFDLNVLVYRYLARIPITLADITNYCDKTLFDLKYKYVYEKEGQPLLATFEFNSASGERRMLEVGPVTPENKDKYINRVARLRLSELQKAMIHVKSGFNKVIKDFEQLKYASVISELVQVCEVDRNFLWSRIKFKQTENSIQKIGQRELNEQQQQLKWCIFEKMTSEELLDFIEYITGVRSLSKYSDSEKYIEVQNHCNSPKNRGKNAPLPIAYTCSNLLQLSHFETKEIMYNRIKWSIDHIDDIMIMDNAGKADFTRMFSDKN